MRGSFIAVANISFSPKAKWRLAGEPETKATQESSHHYRAERGNKARSWEITAAAIVYKPIAFWFVSMIFLSGLVQQHDR